MNSCNLRVLTLLIAFSMFTSSSQNPATSVPLITPPGNLQILDGYTWTPKVNKDALGGLIAKTSGFSIYFNSSAVKHFYARIFEKKSDFSWLKHQEVNGQQMDVALFKTGEIVASFEGTTVFRAKPASKDELADFFLTVMTFESGKDGAASASIVTIPGNIRLLDRFVHQQRNGIDSRLGTIRKDDGLAISYDIGAMASGYLETAKENPANIVWSKRQTIKGRNFSIILLHDSKVVANFEKEYANFFANPKDNEELSEFLLTVLTYNPRLPGQ